MATLEELQAQRQATIAEIQRRGGAAKAPNYAARLEQIDAQIRQMRAAPPTGGGLLPPAPPPPASTPTPSSQDEGFALGSDEASLMQQRANALEEIKRRGGKDQAPNYAKRLELIDAALHQIRIAPGYTPPGSAPPPAGQAPAPPPPPGETPPPPPGTPTPNYPGPDIPGNVGETNTPGNASNPNQPQPTTPVTPDAGTIQKDTNKFDLDKPGKAYETDYAAEERRARQEILLNNPNTYTPFGTQKVTQNPDGSLNVHQTLSEDQQKILDQDEAISSLGRDIAIKLINTNPSLAQNFNPEVAQRMSSGDFAADRQRIEDEVFGRLTRDYDTKYKRAEDEVRQRLNVQGIPYSADPNSRYQQELKGLRDQRARDEQDARGYATQLGGEEWQRGFNIQEQTIANQYNQAAGVRNQQLSDINQFSGLGTGLQLPNFPGYTGTQFQTKAPTDIYGQFELLTDADKDRALQKWAAQLAAKKAGGGGSSGGNSTPAAPSPFSNTTPPGL